MNRSTLQIVFLCFLLLVWINAGAAQAQTATVSAGTGGLSGGFAHEIPSTPMTVTAKQVNGAGELELSSELGPLDLSLSAADGDLSAFVGKEFTLEFASSGEHTGQASISVGLTVEGLGSAVMDRLRDKPFRLTVRRPFVLEAKHRAYQDKLVPPQRTGEAIVRTSNTQSTRGPKVRFGLDGSVEFEFPLAATCDDRQKHRPTKQTEFAGVRGMPYCVERAFYEFWADAFPPAPGLSRPATPPLYLDEQFKILERLDWDERVWWINALHIAEHLPTSDLVLVIETRRYSALRHATKRLVEHEAFEHLAEAMREAYVVEDFGTLQWRFETAVGQDQVFLVFREGVYARWVRDEERAWIDLNTDAFDGEKAFRELAASRVQDLLSRSGDDRIAVFENEDLKIYAYPSLLKEFGLSVENVKNQLRPAAEGT